MPSGAFQGLAVSVQDFWECEGDGEPGQLTGNLGSAHTSWISTVPEDGSNF